MTELRVIQDSGGEAALVLRIQSALSGAEGAELRLQGSFELADAATIWEQLQNHIAKSTRGTSLNLEMSGVQRVDGGVMAVLAHVRAELQQRGVKSEFVGATEE